LSREERLAYIKKIEEFRKSRVITYITSDRPGLGTQIADDTTQLFYDILETMGHQERIDLYLYTRGGNTVAPLRIVRLIREYCKSFNVLVPYRAHSAGTLIAIGGDSIIMGPLAELSPVDPSTMNDFNPLNPTNPSQRIPISVEDITAYLTLAEKQAKLTSEATRLEVFKGLTSQLNVIALGNVQRVYSEIRAFTESLLRLSMTSEKERAQIPKIIQSLTESYTHDYLITRSEAKQLGLDVTFPKSELEKEMMGLLRVYERDLLLRDPFNPDVLLEGNESTEFSFETAYVESTEKTFAFIQSGSIQRIGERIQLAAGGTRPVQPSNITQVAVRLIKQKWESLGGR